MADTRFYSRSGPFSVRAIAEHVGADLSNAVSDTLQIRDLAALDAAEPHDLSLFSDRSYRKEAAASRAGAVLTTRDLGPLVPCSSCLLYVSEPRHAFARIANLFYPPRPVESGIHANAVIDPEATIGPGCRIDAGAVIGCGAVVGARCHIGSNAVIGDYVSIGDDSLIGANTTIRNALIGSRVRISSNASVGGEGFGFVHGSRGQLRFLQLGRVIMGDDVEIGSNTSIDRGAMADTVIGPGTVIDNQVQIAHNVRIGRYCVLAGQVGVAGSAQIGDHVIVGGRTAISDHVKIGSNARIAGGSGIMRDVADGEIVGGYPAVPIRQWHRQTAGLGRLFNSKPKTPRDPD